MDSAFDPDADTYPKYLPDLDNVHVTNCNYCDVSDLHIFNSLFFSILMINIRSCKKNFNHFLALFSSVLTYFTCIVFTETWLSCESDNVYSIPGFHYYDLYRNQYGGGIKIYVRNGIHTRVLSDFTLLSDLFEMLTIELCLDCKKYVLSAVYHPPTSSHENNYDFVYSYTSYLRELIDRHSDSVVTCGDFNLNLLNPNNFGYIDCFINNMFEIGLTPHINIPTKVNLENAITRFSILDQIWSSHSLSVKRAFVTPVDITDHFPVGIFTNVHHDLKTNAIKKRPLREKLHTRN